MKAKVRFTRTRYIESDGSDFAEGSGWVEYSSRSSPTNRNLRSLSDNIGGASDPIDADTESYSHAYLYGIPDE